MAKTKINKDLEIPAIGEIQAAYFLYSSRRLPQNSLLQIEYRFASWRHYEPVLETCV